MSKKNSRSFPAVPCVRGLLTSSATAMWWELPAGWSAVELSGDLVPYFGRGCLFSRGSRIRARAVGYTAAYHSGTG